MSKTVALIEIRGMHFIAFDPAEMEELEIDSDTLVEMSRKDHETLEIKFVREKSDPRYEAFIERRDKALGLAKAIVDWHNLIENSPATDNQ